MAAVDDPYHRYFVRDAVRYVVNSPKSLILLLAIACIALSSFGLTSCTTKPAISEPSDLIFFPPYARGFGEVQLGTSVERPLTICNTGTSQIDISQINSNNAVFVPRTTSLTIAPGDTITININFTPADLGPQLGFLTLKTDDAGNTRRLALAGAGTNENITIEARPFGMIPQVAFHSASGLPSPDLMSPLGIFIIGEDSAGTTNFQDPQNIGIYLKNTGTADFTDVNVRLDVPLNSGIVVVKDTVMFDVLKPGVPVLAFFSARFAGSRPGLFPLTLNITADGSFVNQVSRKIFVMKARMDSTDLAQGPPDTFVAMTPGGTLTRLTRSYLDPLPRLTGGVPLSLVDTQVPFSPYTGQVSPPPFPDDAPWKAAGAAVTAGGAVVALIGLATDDNNLKEAGTGIAAVGAITTFLDGEDPFRRGQLNTVPLPTEMTIRETVDANVIYLQRPEIGKPFKAEVAWEYTRFLDSGREVTFAATDIVRNDRIVTDRVVNVNQDTLRVGDTLVITAQFRQCGGGFLSGLDAFVLAGISTSGTSFIDKMIVLTDDGQRGDAVALDGLYTSTVAISPADNLGDWNIFVFAQDINLAPQTSDITVLPYFIGGVGLSFPADDGFRILPDRTVRIQ